MTGGASGGKESVHGRRVPTPVLGHPGACFGGVGTRVPTVHKVVYRPCTGHVPTDPVSIGKNLKLLRVPTVYRPPSRYIGTHTFRGVYRLDGAADRQVSAVVSGRQLVSVELPYPRHSGNRSVRHGGGGHSLSASAQDYRSDVRPPGWPIGVSVAAR